MLKKLWTVLEAIALMVDDSLRVAAAGDNHNNHSSQFLKYIIGQTWRVQNVPSIFIKARLRRWIGLTWRWWLKRRPARRIGMIRGGEKILVSQKNKEKKEKWPKQGWGSSKKTKTKKTRTIKGGRCDKCGSWWRAGVMKSRASYVGTTVPAQLCSTYQLSLPPCPPTPTHFSPRCPDFALSQQLCPTLLAPHELERLC